MAELTDKGTVCLVVVLDEYLNWRIFGVYDNEDLAKQRVDELGYLIPDDCTVHFRNEIVWGVRDV